MPSLIKTYSFISPTTRTVLTANSTPTAVRPIVQGSIGPHTEEGEPKGRVRRITPSTRRHK